MNREEKLIYLNKEMGGIGDESPKRKIKRIEEHMIDIKENIDRYGRYLKEAWENYISNMKQVEALKSIKPKDYKEDFKSILDHKYVKDVYINSKQNELIIETDYIDIYDEDDNKFKGNKYELVFDFNRMTCYISGLDEDYCRKSYWTETDPHPHVNGETGEACWGSAGCMLTENMNNYEIYASFIVVLNFLQQVNTEDAAGKFIRNWDCISEDGKDLENPYKGDYLRCTTCGYEIESENAYYCEDCEEHMCDDHAYYIDYGNKYVCEECFDNEYVTCDHCSERMHEESEYKRTVGDNTYCKDCFENLFRVCSNCDEVEEKENISTIDGKNYCEECYDDLFIECDECGVVKKKEDTFYCNSCNTTYCENCMEEPIPGMCQDCFEQEEVETVNI